jgi:hypothetical protein
MTLRLRLASSSRRHFVERERKTRRAIAAGERDMLAQHTDESFRADHVRFRNAGGAVVQMLMRSDFFATEAFFCDHATPFWNSGEIRGIARDGAADQVERHNRIVAQSRATRHGTARHQEKPDQWVNASIFETAR